MVFARKVNSVTRESTQIVPYQNTAVGTESTLTENFPEKLFVYSSRAINAREQYYSIFVKMILHFNIIIVSN